MNSWIDGADALLVEFLQPREGKEIQLEVSELKSSLRCLCRVFSEKEWCKKYQLEAAQHAFVRHLRETTDHPVEPALGKHVLLKKFFLR